MALYKLKYNGFSLKKTLKIVIEELEWDAALTDDQRFELSDIILEYSRSLISRKECVTLLDNYVRSQPPRHKRQN